MWNTTADKRAVLAVVSDGRGKAKLFSYITKRPHPDIAA